MALTEIFSKVLKHDSGDRNQSERPVADTASHAKPLTNRTLDRLRHETAAIHADLDQSLDVISRFRDSRARIDLVAAYYEFHRLSETAIRPHLAEISALELAARCRSAVIAGDLRALGIKSLPECAGDFIVDNRAQALGALYVLEGSAFGGRVILKLLKQHGSALTELGFLDPYGARTASLWRSFLEVLERETAHTETSIADAVNGAVKTFAFAKATLCSKGLR